MNYITLWIGGAAMIARGMYADCSDWISGGMVLLFMGFAVLVERTGQEEEDG